jgi:Domain found in Dishevelled, Egl-10, and Pleckstrin (DEP)
MSRPADPEVFLHLPTGSGTDALRAGLMAMKCIPTNLPLQASERQAVLKRASHSFRTFLLIDVSNQKPGAADSLDAVCRDVPESLRSRTLLTRLAGGHVSSDDRAWVKALGFVDMIAEIDVNDLQGDLRVVIDAAARLLALEPLSLTELARYVGAVAASASGKAPLTLAPRALIRAHTELSAEKLVELLRDKLAIHDRSYHFKNYPACFVASESVTWLGSRFGLVAADAVAVGQALGALGLLYHVEQKHTFDNEPWFFRLAMSRSVNTLSYSEAVKALRERLAVADRTYLGTAYPKCWVGTQAVDVICTYRPMPRYQAHRILHRLMSLGLFRHVVDEQPFVDGNFFYRFNTS